MTFKRGQSGNPKGRPRGTKNTATALREKISKVVPEILDKLIQAARDGDIQAARLLVERALPALRSMEMAQPMELPEGTLTEQGRAVLAAVAAGKLAPSQGAQLVAAIGQLARVSEIDELEKRLKALEGQHGQQHE